MLKTRCGLPARVQTRLVSAAGFEIEGVILEKGREYGHLWHRDGRWSDEAEEHPFDLLDVPGADFEEATGLA